VEEEGEEEETAEGSRMWDKKREGEELRRI